jgi:LmbE family N-acetylglucosaminyl deacetylase
MTARQTIAAIFAHPDDEVLGAGATLARHAARGDSVRILILATGLAARGDGERRAIEKLRDQARRAADTLGAQAIEFADFPDNRMDTVALLDVVQRVEAYLTAGAPPARVFTHHGGDLNIDHRIVHQAVMTACRPLPGVAPFEILAGEVASSTEWVPNATDQFQPSVFVDASATLKAKLAALACYAGEMRDWPHPRSIEGLRVLARWRGAQCGHEAAEAFMLMRRTE